MIEFLRSRRTLGVVCGFLLVSVGLILSIPFVPGPGIPLVVLGLVILSGHFTWAKRFLDWAKQKLNWSGEAISPSDFQAPAPPSPVLTLQTKADKTDS